MSGDQGSADWTFSRSFMTFRKGSPSLNKGCMSMERRRLCALVDEGNMEMRSAVRVWLEECAQQGLKCWRTNKVIDCKLSQWLSMVLVEVQCRHTKWNRRNGGDSVEIWWHICFHCVTLWPGVLLNLRLSEVVSVLGFLLLPPAMQICGKRMFGVM